jgi:hypothetical protein
VLVSQLAVRSTSILVTVNLSPFYFPFTNEKCDNHCMRIALFRKVRAKLVVFLSSDPVHTE